MIHESHTCTCSCSVDREILTSKNIHQLNFHVVSLSSLQHTRSVALLVDVQC